MKSWKTRFPIILTMMLLLVGIVSASASNSFVYDYEGKEMWYQTTKNVQILRDPPKWDNVAELFADELYSKDPTIGFDMEAFINSPAGEGTIKLLEPIVLFEDEMGEDLLAYWREKGITKELINADDPENKYATYVPVDMDKSGKTYPLMVLMSGGSDPIFTVEGFGVVAYGAKAGYITVAIQTRDADTQIAIIDSLIEKYPIDTSRIYMTGNGGGMMSSMNTLVRYPEYFAAAAPFGCGFMLTRSGNRFLTDEELEDNFINSNIQLPIQVLDGTSARTSWHPIIWRADADEQIYDYNLWFRINNIIAPELTRSNSMMQVVNSDKRVNNYTGLNFTTAWTYYLETEYYFGEFYDVNDVPMFRIGIAKDISHWHSASYPGLIWDFCSMYSRDADTGAIIYQP